MNVTLRVVTRRQTMQPQRLEEAPDGEALVSADGAVNRKMLEETSAAVFSSRGAAEMSAKGVTPFTGRCDLGLGTNLAPTNVSQRRCPGIFSASLCARFSRLGLGAAIVGRSSARADSS